MKNTFSFQVALVLFILTHPVLNAATTSLSNPTESFKVYSEIQIDILVVGGGASGTAAGIQAARLGSNTLVIEESTWLGGMLTAAGVSAVDGNYKLPSGIFGEFGDRLVSYYGNANALKTGWVSNMLFEPSIGNSILKNMVNSQQNLTVWYETKFVSAQKVTDGWSVVVDKAGVTQTILAKVMIDATELGDVAKYCGVGYDIGMDARAVSGEANAPLAANNIVQDLTYVLILKNYGVNKTITQPASYVASKFFCTAQSANCASASNSVANMMNYGKLPNGKYMINWPIEGNDFYVNLIEKTPAERKVELDKAKEFSLCYLYYLQTQLGLSTYGLADEFPTPDKLPFIPYHRESRRIHGLVRFNINDVSKPFEQADALYRTGIAVGDYPIDHHHKRYSGTEPIPTLSFPSVPSYSLPLGTLIPQNVKRLIVAEKSISVSNIVNGSTRLQPVVLQIGQAAGALAALSVKQNIDVEAVSIRDVQTELLNAGVYLLPYLDLPKTDASFKALQRIGATGILKGTGITVGWSNETWFYINNSLLLSDLKKGLSEFEPTLNVSVTNSTLTVADAIQAINEMADFYKKPTISSDVVQANWQALNLTNFNLSRNIIRKEFAVLLDYSINPFQLKAVDIKGKLHTAVVNSIKPQQADSEKVVVSDNTLTVLDVKDSCTIGIYDCLGRKIKSSNRNIIDTKMIHGLCIVKINEKGKSSRTFKVIL